MPSSFDLFSGGTAVTDFDTSVLDLEIEENVDLPGAFRVTLPVKVSASGDYDTVSDPRFGPLSNIAVTAQAADGQAHCLIDGFVLAQDLHLDAGASASTLKITGQDASWLMNMTETVREWADVTDGAAANTIFGDYGFTPDPANLDDDSAAHTSDTASLMQRASDAQFLRDLARRSGKLFRVFCTDKPGERTGAFVTPSVAGEPALMLALNPSDDANIGPLQITWDVMRPSSVTAQQLLFSDASGEASGGETTASGLADLDAKNLAAFAGQPVSTLLTTQAGDAETVALRAQSVLRESGWFVRCEGSTDAVRLGAIMRAGTVVQVNSAGSLHSGKYFVWSVRHHITANAHEMKFVLMRNAVGAPSPGGVGFP
ncbi:hypothetical protein [Novosphingobium lentum]|uniref:hypothetical protein n=1 Tax=Novosphingobium lentum TaxID=145287 RepID=UPI000831429A|nr:hypothetical protein [Novosphingobium lentum]